MTQTECWRDDFASQRAYGEINEAELQQVVDNLSKRISSYPEEAKAFIAGISASVEITHRLLALRNLPDIRREDGKPGFDIDKVVYLGRLIGMNFKEVNAATLAEVVEEAILYSDRQKLSCDLANKPKKTQSDAANPTYPSPRTYEKDKFIYENIESMSFKKLQLALKHRKNFGSRPITSEIGFRKAAKRYSDFYNLSARNFRSATKCN